MKTLYTDEIKEIVMGAKWPFGLSFHVIEYPQYLAIRFYRDNFVSLDRTAQLRTASVVGEVVSEIRQKGIPCYLEKV